MLNKLVKTTALLLISLFLFTPASYSGLELPDTDSIAFGAALFYFFDLRDRETFIQLTSVDTSDGTLHVQIFDVSNNCDENNFFDTYTPADTHVYNMRDIVTNDGNPSGVVLPDNAYGFVSIINFFGGTDIIGNFRILDDEGYEYRTNAVNIFGGESGWAQFNPNITFNYNTNGDISLSDVVGITFVSNGEISAADILDIWAAFDVDILNKDEVIFSCRNVIFACADQDNPLYEELLDESGDASVASFEYGINNAIPHSRGGELLCPGNTISEGFVTLNLIGAEILGNFIGYIGLNNGNGRGSMDSMWYSNDDVGDDDDDG